jgi:hypothetical protein
MGERVVERDDAAPGSDAGVARRTIVRERGAHARVQAIGADHDGAALHAAADQTHRDRLPILVDGRALGAEPDGVRAERAPHHGLKPGAVDDDERSAEAGLQPRRNRRTELRATPAAKGAVARGSARRLDRVADAQAPQRPDRVGPQRDARPNLAQLRCALEHEHVAAGALQSDRRREAGDARADDQCAIVHASTVRAPVFARVGDPAGAVRRG